MAFIAHHDIDPADVAREVERLEMLVGQSVAISLAAGAANVMTVTVQVKDGKGANLTAPVALDLWFSDNATSGVLTSTAYSGTLVASTGSIRNTLTAAKSFQVMTDATGKFVGGLTATGKPATEHVVVRQPVGAGFTVSGASGANWG